MEYLELIGEIALQISVSGLKKKYLASKIGLTDSELSHLLAGRRKYKQATKKLCELLKIDFPT